MDELNATLASLGLSMPSPAYLIGMTLFSLIGFAAYRRGKRLSLGKFKWIGIALMLYPYAIYGTALLYIVGAALCLALYVWRD